MLFSIKYQDVVIVPYSMGHMGKIKSWEVSDKFWGKDH